MRTGQIFQTLQTDRLSVARPILEGIREFLTVTRLGLPKELRRLM
jgi:hypothetical protein